MSVEERPGRVAASVCRGGTCNDPVLLRAKKGSIELSVLGTIGKSLLRSRLTLLARIILPSSSTRPWEFGCSEDERPMGKPAFLRQRGSVKKVVVCVVVVTVVVLVSAMYA